MKINKIALNHFSKWWAPILIGVTGFILIVGPNVLHPKNINWLLTDFDMTLEYLGWAFYRHSPWSSPIGLNPNFGLDISSSIIYSNSLPIFSILFKPFSSILSEPFQFWGLWILFCFVMQAWMSWLLLGLITKDLLLKTFATGILVFAPPLISQIGFHNSTVAHFPILAAFYLIFRQNQSKRILWWSILLPSTLLIHPYTFAMVVALWLSGLVNQFVVQKNLKFWQVSKEFLSAVTSTILVAWQAGYFMGVNPRETGFGLYRTNLLGLFDSSGFDSHDWSFIFSLPSIKANNNYEGFIYLGLGLIIVFILAIPKIISRRSNLLGILKKYPFIFLGVLALSLFALSNNIGIGPWNFKVPLTPEMFSFFSILRASGRMFWPMFYVVSFVAIYYLIKGYSKKFSLFVLVIAFVSQVIDTSGAWLEIRQKLNNPVTQLNSPFNNPFWESAPKKYTKLVRVPVWNEQSIWEKFASYAAHFQMGTNSVFMGRVDKTKIEQSNQKVKEMISLGKFDSQTLYIVEDEYVKNFIANMNPQVDLLARFDEINVFAPGWKNCLTCPLVDVRFEIDPSLTTARLTKLGERIDFSRFGKYSTVYLGNGWSVPENWGVWSLGRKATIKMPLPDKTPGKLIIHAQAFINGAHQRQVVNIVINGKENQSFVLDKRYGNKIEVILPLSTVKLDNLILDFELPSAISPKELGIGSDTRLLAIGLEAIYYE
jgi:hypothetical protein